MSQTLDQLNRQLRELNRGGEVTPCAGDDRWISEDRNERRKASVLCLPCPVYSLCRAVGQSRGTQRPHHGVWGGLDVSQPPEIGGAATEGLSGPEAHLLVQVLTVVTQRPGLITADVKTAVHERGFTGRDREISKALARAVAAGELERRPGARHSFHWYPINPEEQL